MSRRQRVLFFVLQHLPLLLCGIVLLGFGLAAPRFLEYQSLENVVKQASTIGILAVGMTVVLLTAGIDLSVGANMYVSAAVAGLLMQQAGWSGGAAFGACLAAGGLFGAVNALAVTRLRIIPFIATLATLVAGRGLGLMLTGSQAIPVPDAVLTAGASRVLSLPVPIVGFVLVVAAVHLVLQRTPFGRQVYAVGHDVDAALKGWTSNGC